MSKNIFVSFDVDGTLILFDTIQEHLDAFKDAISELVKPCGYPDEVVGESTLGWMDYRIIVSCIKNLGVEPTDELVDKIQSRMEELYSQRFNVIPNVPPGIVRVLEKLSSMPNVKLGLASGNLPGIAWKKLENGGILKYFPDRIGGFGVKGCLVRKEAVANARKMAEEKFGIKFDKAIHIGDMPADIQAAIDNGVTGVAVRTGVKKNEVYPQPSYVFNNLEESYDEFMKLIE